MMQLIDKREVPPKMVFADLAFGECYQDCTDNLCMKIGYDRCMKWGGSNWVPTFGVDLDELVTPLKTTITVEREDI